MKTIRHRPLLMAFIAALGCTALGAGYMLSTAKAAGPVAHGALHYSGYMEDISGAPVTGNRNVGIKLWSNNSTTKEVCDTPATSISVQQGHFRVPLKQACNVLLHTYPEAWVEVIVDSESLGPSKRGAAPYAVQATASPIEISEGCPTDYTRDKTATGITLCKQGNDEMVKVADFWIDRYEMAVVSSSTYNNGACNGSWQAYGQGTDDYPPAGFPDNGAWTGKLHACSVAGKTPSDHLTWFQAQQACLLAGKRLCTNGEWQAATAGTPDSTVCNIQSSGVVAGSASSLCTSSWGAVNLPGNIWEWVAEWRQAGRPVSGFTDGQQFTPMAPASSYGQDRVWNINGKTHDGSGFIDGLPAGVARGGTFQHGSQAGNFAVAYNIGPSSTTVQVGSRCCRD